MMCTVARFLKDRAGVTSIEYVFIATLVGIAVIAGASSLGLQLNVGLESVSDKVPAV